MMRRIELFLIVFLLHAGSIAGDVPESTMSSNVYFKGMASKKIEAFCRAGHGGTEDRDFCKKREFERAAFKLNGIYKEVFTSAKKTDANNPDTAPVAPKIASSQRVWMQYRKTECETQYAFIGTGTMRYQQYYACLAELTNDRAKVLQSGYF